jgi:hypothetical protein
MEVLMRHQFLTNLSNLVRRSPRSAFPTCPTLERLEDRCVPSADFMPSMSMPMMGMGFMPVQQIGMGFMPMQPMGMDSMSVQQIGVTPMPMQQVGTNTAVTSTTVTSTAAMNTTNNPPSPATLAALNQLFTDFNRTMLQVLSSQTLQQFVVNETAMLRIITADLIHIMATESPTIQGG